jgi:hypothetical protein
VAEHGREGIEEISSIAYGFMGSQALFAALELGLFTSLSLGSRDETELADELDARPEALRTLLTACRAMGLLERDEGGYRNSARAQRFLVRTSRSYMGDYYLRQIALTVYEQVPLARAVLRGELEVSPSYGAFLDDPDRTEEFIRGQHAGSSGPAYLLATSEDLSRFSRLLDLGGGSGVFSIEAVRRNPALGAVVFDHAGVIPAARRRPSAPVLRAQLLSAGRPHRPDLRVPTRWWMFVGPRLRARCRPFWPSQHRPMVLRQPGDLG